VAALLLGAVIPIVYLLFRVKGTMVGYYGVTVALPGAVVLIGGLLSLTGVWTPGTRRGALAASLVGGVALASLAPVALLTPPHATVNGQWVLMFTMLSTIVGYVGASYLTCKQDFNLERMLHRGQYVAEDRTAESLNPSKVTWQEVLFGFDKNFTAGDRFISLGLFAWTMLWFAVFIVGVGWNAIAPWPLAYWSDFWYHYMVFLPLIITVVTTVWFTFGVTRDLRRMYHRLETVSRNDADDGRVGA
jgi:SSS family solute:Na+ symporter